MRHHPMTAVASVLILLAIAGGTAMSQSKAPKPKESSVKGEVVDLWCYLNDGSHGANHKDCAVSCAKAGNPIGIVDAKGKVYVAMSEKNHEPNLSMLIDKMSETVTVTGKVVDKGGTRVVYVSSVK